MSHPLVILEDMEIAVVVERVREVASVRGGGSAGREAIEAALRSASRVRAWLAAAEADLARQLSSQVSFPEKAIADCTRTSLNDALKATERAETLAAVPEFADALDDAEVTAGHVDALTRATKGLNNAQRSELFERAASLVNVAAAATVREFGRRLDHEVRSIQRDDGLAKLERQKRAASLRSWTDGDGMWCIAGRFDPLTGVKIAARLDAAVEALFAEATPDTCPTDPIAKQQHLAALALARLLAEDRSSDAGTRPGRPEYVVVVDSSQPDGARGPLIDWGIPVEVPARVLADLMGDGSVHTIVVRNGVILHAPGELNLGRTTRLANAAQRRALRALYAACAIPSCTVRYDRCKLHHVIWWRHGGCTDLHNLLPLCPMHHTKLHADGWVVTLGAHRELTIRFPDGTIHNTGPPRRSAA